MRLSPECPLQNQEATKFRHSPIQIPQSAPDLPQTPNLAREVPVNLHSTGVRLGALKLVSFWVV